MPQYKEDIGLRKEILKEKRGTITFNINDVFNTQRFGNIYDTENFYREAFRCRNVRSFRINFIYKFGSDDFKIFGKENRQRDNEED